MNNIPILFVFRLILSTSKVHNSLLGHMSRGGGAALDFSSLLFRSGYPLSILRVVLVDGGCVDVLIIIRLQTEESLVLGELIPSSSARDLLKGAVVR